MAKKLTTLRAFFYTAQTALLLSVLLTLSAACCQSQDASQPIAFRYIKDSDLKEKPALPVGIIFWVTNNTPFRQSITVLSLQIRKESNWIDLPLETPDVMKFSPPGPLKGVPSHYPRVLRPHAGEYGCPSGGNDVASEGSGAKAIIRNRGQSSSIEDQNAPSRHKCAGFQGQ